MWIPLVIIHFIDGFPLIDPPFGGTPIDGNTHITLIFRQKYIYIYDLYHILQGGAPVR